MSKAAIEHGGEFADSLAPIIRDAWPQGIDRVMMWAAIFSNLYGQCVSDIGEAAASKVLEKTHDLGARVVAELKSNAQSEEG